MIVTLFALALAAATDGGGATSVHDLAWMVGDRVQQGGKAVAEEVWIDGGDMLLGVSATVKDGHTVEYEHLRVGTGKDGRIAYFAEPSGQDPAAFPLKSFDGERVVFENLTHDFPQRIIYWKKPDGAVGARIEGVIKGQARGQEWTFSPSTRR